jgi:hypothetical protein
MTNIPCSLPGCTSGMGTVDAVRYTKPARELFKDFIILFQALRSCQNSGIHRRMQRGR